MTRILLIRHGNTDLVNLRLCGRLSGIPLNSEGILQAQAAGETLSARGQLEAVYSSPLERATETAAIIAGRRAVDVEIDERLNEMQFGEWTGRTFQSLQTLEDWQVYNRHRSLHRPPGGESLMQVQARAWESLSDMIRRHADGTVAVVTHADVIRSLLVLFLGMSLDHLLRIQIDPGSVTEVTLGGDYPVVSCINLRIRQQFSLEGTT